MGLLLVLGSAGVLRAQAREDVMSAKEVDSLRDSAYVPMDRVQAFSKILDAREKRIDDLLSGRRHAGFALEMHDLLDQFGAIADEFNDNLDGYGKQHRDLRKVLPKLVQATERWSTSLHAPPADDAYKVVQRIALDAVKDMREIAEGLERSEEAYFKEHPDAAKAEKQRNEAPHAPTSEGPPR